MLVSYMYVNYVNCGSKDQLKVNINVFDASGIFRDVYIRLLCKLCGLRPAVALDLRRVWVAGYSEV